MVNGFRNTQCEKKRMEYFRCEKKIQTDDTLPTVCDKVKLHRCLRKPEYNHINLLKLHQNIITTILIICRLMLFLQDALMSTVNAHQKKLLKQANKNTFLNWLTPQSKMTYGKNLSIVSLFR